MTPGLDKGDWDKLRRLEEALWIESTRFDIPYMEKILAEDFIEVGRSGRVYLRGDILAVPRQPIDAALPLPYFKVRFLSTDVALVTYESEVRHEEAVQYGRRSSIWVRAGSNWVLKFHQGTPFEKDT